MPDKSFRKKSKVKLKKTQSVRDKVAKASTPKKTRKLTNAKSSVSKPIKKIAAIGRKQYHPIKLPKSKYGEFLTKSRKFTPGYFRASWQELKQVIWPNKKETIKLTIAVFLFAIFFALLISLVDYGLDKAFKSLILK